MYFRKCAIQCNKDDYNVDDHLIEGEYWEFKEPDRVEAWSLFMIPFKNEMTLSYKFKGVEVYLQVLFQAKIKDVEVEMHPIVKIKCMTTIPDIDKKDQYHFAVCIDLVLIPFNLSLFLSAFHCIEVGLRNLKKVGQQQVEERERHPTYMEEVVQ